MALESLQLTPDDTVLLQDEMNPMNVRQMQMIERLKQLGAKKIVVHPDGPREKEQPTLYDTFPAHRAAIIAKMTRDIPEVRVDYSSLEAEQFTPTIELYKRLKTECTGRVFVCLKSRHVREQSYLAWHEGQAFTGSIPSIVFNEGEPIAPEAMPEYGYQEAMRPHPSSEQLRGYANKADYDGLAPFLPKEVLEYIRRWKVYRASANERVIRDKLPELKFLPVVDKKYNKPALNFAETMSEYVDKTNPNFILAFGGDGTLLKAAHLYHHLRIPIIGVNYGTVGYLLNGKVEKKYSKQELIDHLSGEVTYYRQSLLQGEWTLPDGTTDRGYSFNDVYCKPFLPEDREDDDVIDLNLTITTKNNANTSLTLPLGSVSGDTFMVSTPAGSTGYATKDGQERALSLRSEELLMRGVMLSWRDINKDSLRGASELYRQISERRVEGLFPGINISNTDTVYFENANPKRRMMSVFCGKRIPRALRGSVTGSRTADIELIKFENDA